MRKIFLFVLFLLTTAPAVWAHESSAANDLRDMAVAETFLYGQTLYERRDYSEARNVFFHILEMDPNYAPAIAYLRKMGEIPMEPAVSCCAMPQPMAAMAPMDPNDPNADLKQDIASENQAIGTLNQELTQMHTQTQKVSHE